MDGETLALAAWRAFGRSKLGDLSSPLEKLAPMLATAGSVERVWIRAVDRRRDEVLTAWCSDASYAPVLPPSTLSHQDGAHIVASFAAADVVEAAHLPSCLVGTSPTPEGAVAGALRDEGMVFGVLVVTFRPGTASATRAGIEPILEPLSVALRGFLSRLPPVAEGEDNEESDTGRGRRLRERRRGETIIGADGGLRHAMALVSQVARTDVPVLLLGETGSGKEVLAHAIHMDSARASGPFLRVNCGAVPSELIDSELFGHERGSFTGASAQRSGWFERADGGTLFLDEIGELSAPAQVRLLRVLQDGTFERVGGQTTRHADVRIVAATHRKLGAMAAEGHFRQDLWYRIAVFEIRIPPLRERREDMAQLAEHFARKAAHRFGMPVVLPTPEDIELLSSYAWPGNVRELAAVIDRAALLANGQRLDVETALGQSSPLRAASRHPPAPTPRAVPVSREGALPSLDRAMVSHIEEALRHTLGRVDGPFGVAQLLGLNPHTLRARMRKLGIDWKRFRRPAKSA
jgi:hydrogenase-4 transcriptional activator